MEEFANFLFLSPCSSQHPGTWEPHRKNMGKPGRFSPWNPDPCLHGNFHPWLLKKTPRNSLPEQRAGAKTFDGESLKRQARRLQRRFLNLRSQLYVVVVVVGWNDGLHVNMQKSQIKLTAKRVQVMWTLVYCVCRLSHVARPMWLPRRVQPPTPCVPCPRICLPMWTTACRNGSWLAATPGDASPLAVTAFTTPFLVNGRVLCSEQLFTPKEWSHSDNTLGSRLLSNTSQFVLWYIFLFRSSIAAADAQVMHWCNKVQKC